MQKSAGVTLLKRIGWTFLAVEAGAWAATAVLFLVGVFLSILFG